MAATQGPRGPAGRPEAGWVVARGDRPRLGMRHALVAGAVLSLATAVWLVARRRFAI